MSEVEPYALSASDAARLIRDGELTPVDLVQSCLSRIEHLDGAIRAWVTLDIEGAHGRARELTDDLRAGINRGPLHGVPVGIKDLYYTSGIRTAAGSPILRDLIPDWDAALVGRMKSAGAIVLGKTVTTEWAASDTPPTRNPWNLQHTPGGSSSGSGAAVAARMCPAATGTQAAGSVIRPASYNGIVGLKPTHGFLDNQGVISHCWSVDHPGILTRTVEDAALFLEAMAHRGPPDGEVVPGYREGLRRRDGPPTFGFIRRFYMDRCPKQLRDQMEDTVQRLAKAGARIEEVDFPGEPDLVLGSHWTLMKVEFAAAHQKMYREHQDEYSPHVRGLIEVGMLIPGASYVEALRVRKEFRDSATNAARAFDALIAPSAEQAPPLAEPGHDAVPRTGDHSFQMPWSFSGLPAISIPCGLGDSGLPIGLQLIGAPYSEERLLSSAWWSEGALKFSSVPEIDAGSVVDTGA